MRTDNSGNAVSKKCSNGCYGGQKKSTLFDKQEQPSSDSVYDSENDGGSDLTTVERPKGAARVSLKHKKKHLQPEEEDSSEERQRHDSAEVDGELWKILIFTNLFINFCKKKH